MEFFNVMKGHENMEQYSIELNNVKKCYKINEGTFLKKSIKEINAISDIRLSIKKNETVGLIGLNGAGKSTLIKIILGILTPDSGDIEVFGRNPHKNRVDMMKNIGVVFGQRPQLRWDVSPYDSYKLNKEIYNIKFEKFEKTLNFLASELDIKDFWERPVRTLSLGQKMRADLVAALLHNPKVLILDEPTLGLDFISKRKILRLIKELKIDMSIIFTSHNLDDVYEVSDRVVLLNKGKIVFDKKTDDISEVLQYVSIEIILGNKLLEFDGHMFPNIKIKEITESRYVISNIQKKDMQRILKYLYKYNELVSFELRENTLEDILNGYA